MRGGKDQMKEIQSIKFKMIDLGSYFELINLGLPNPVLKGSSPAGISILPGR